MAYPGSAPAAGPPHGDTGNPLPVHVRGMVQGRELNAGATVLLVDNGVVLAWEHATPWRLDLGGLDGMQTQPTPTRLDLPRPDGMLTQPTPTMLTFYLSSGDVLELSGNDGLRTFATRLLDRACLVPELTRGLRALGSLRGTPGPAHDRWFAPLLAARRSIAGISDPVQQVALVDAGVIAQQLRRVIADIARDEASNNAPMQRAIDAALQEESEPTFVALERLALAADVLRAGALDTRLVDWRRWISALRDVFLAADECWPRCAKVITHGV